MLVALARRRDTGTALRRSAAPQGLARSQRVEGDRLICDPGVPATSEGPRWDAGWVSSACGDGRAGVDRQRREAPLRGGRVGSRQRQRLIPRPHGNGAGGLPNGEGGIWGWLAQVISTGRTYATAGAGGRNGHSLDRRIEDPHYAPPAHHPRRSLRVTRRPVLALESTVPPPATSDEVAVAPVGQTVTDGWKSATHPGRRQPRGDHVGCDLNAMRSASRSSTPTARGRRPRSSTGTPTGRRKRGARMRSLPRPIPHGRPTRCGSATPTEPCAVHRGRPAR